MADTANVGEVFGALNVERITAYVQVRTPEQLWKEIEAANLDPTDVLGYADLLLQFLKKEEHAMALYVGALRELESHPDRIAQDTNLMGAWLQLFHLAARRGHNKMAIHAYTAANALGSDDPFDKVMFALSLHAVGR